MKAPADWAIWTGNVALAFVMAFGSESSVAQGIATIQGGGTQAFVTGFTPVIGPNGGVGGVSIDTSGVVRLAKDIDALRDRWIQPRGLNANVSEETGLRIISLRRLHAQLRDRLEKKQPIAEEMFFLAGLRRVEFLFVVPEQSDVLIAGPAGGWRSNGLAQTVSTKTGTPILRLDDLAVAFQCELDSKTSTSCSIEPSEEGLARFANLRSRTGGSPQATVRAMEKAMGMQRVLLTDVPRDSHFAAVMVAADFWMKRYALGFDSPPVEDMPSYMTLLQQNPRMPRLTSPRWWMATNYDSLGRAPDGLTWQLAGPAVRTLTQDSVFRSDGRRIETGERNVLAERWAETMTSNFAALCRERPVFGELRNCFDLSVIAAIIAQERLLDFAKCELPLLTSASAWAPTFNVPTEIPSQGSLVRVRSGWAVSISGGVDIDTKSVIEKWQEQPGIHSKVKRPYPEDTTRWWW